MPGKVRKRTPKPPDDGIDVSLIRWMLSLTPAERLQALQQHVQSVQRLLSEKRDS